MAGDEPRLVIYSARWKDGVFLLLFLLFVGLIVWSRMDDPTRAPLLATIFALLVFGTGAIATAWSLFRRQRLVLTPEGFAIVGSKRGPVTRWSDVDEFFVLRMYGSSMATWRYRPGREPAPVGVVERLLSGFAPSVGTGSVGPGWSQSPKRLVATLTEWRDRYGA